MVILGILVIGFGILLLVARDFFWALTEMGNSFAGRTSERTELWEAGQVISGLFMIGLGAFVICAGSAEDRQREERRVAPTQTAVAMEAFSSTLDRVFAEFIPQWERSSESGVQTVRPASIGISADAITYGRCEDGRFFAAVEGYEGRFYEDYLYLPEGDPVTCENGHLRFYGGGDANVAWRRVTISEDLTARYAAQFNATLNALLTVTPEETATEPAAEATEQPTATRRPRQ